ncbi:MAG: hypothetical protein H6Q60_252 [Oscillospiraceae bacterium]|nr:hypothetical protein [Oscillospiraceae bacterium]
MSLTVGVIGIILCLVVQNYFIYKGLSPVISSVIATLIIIFTSNLPLQSTWDTGMSSLGGTLAVLVPLLVFGGIMGTLYSKSGATVAIVNLLLKPFEKTSNVNAKRIGGIAIILIFRVIIGFAGFDNLAIMVTMVAIVVAVFAKFDMPRKYINCLLIVAGNLGVLIPGAPQAYLIMLEQYMTGFSNSSNIIPRTFLLVLFLVGSILILNYLIKRDYDKGVHFEAGPLEIPDFETIKTPHWIAAFIPLLAVFVTYNFFGCAAWLSMLFGTLASAILFAPYLPHEEGTSKFGVLVKECNDGVFAAPIVMLINMLPGFVMAASPAFDYMVQLLSAIPIPSAFGLLIIGILLTGASGTSAIILVSSIVLSIYVPGGMSVQACGVVTIWTLVVLDNLPNSLGIVLQNEMTGVTMKESYPPIFKTAVVFAFIVSILTAAMASIGIFG